MSDHSISPPLKKPVRTFEQAQKDVRKVRAQRRALGICECGRGMKRKETEMCQACEDDAQDGVVYLDEERKLRVVERLYAGDET